MSKNNKPREDIEIKCDPKHLKEHPELEMTETVMLGKYAHLRGYGKIHNQRDQSLTNDRDHIEAVYLASVFGQDPPPTIKFFWYHRLKWWIQDLFTFKPDARDGRKF